MARQAWQWIKASPVRLTIFVVAMVLLIVALIPTVVTWAPHWLASTRGLNASQRAEEVGRVRSALLAVLAGGVAIIGAIYTGRTFALNRQGHELDRQGQITERFTRAVDQLGNANLDVRLGGIYALERVARDSREDHGPIMEILTAYAREHAGRHTHVEENDGDTGPGKGSVGSESPATDVQAVLTVLGRRRVEYDSGRRLDLAWIVLTGAYLVEADLRGANLRGANLQRAKLVNANLEGADLMVANLQGADLRGASLPRSNVRQAILEDADLTGANLTEASLNGANLLAELEGADLQAADLRGAHLRYMNLAYANLRGANLQGADLGGTTLKGANLKGANLQDANLRKPNFDQETIWPEGFEPDGPPTSGGNRS